VPNRNRVMVYGTELVIATMLTAFGRPHGHSVLHHLARIAINGTKYESRRASTRGGSRTVEIIYPRAQKTVQIGIEVSLIGIMTGSTFPDASRRKILLASLRNDLDP
jgi:hypothetical protein